MKRTRSWGVVLVGLGLLGGSLKGAQKLTPQQQLLIAQQQLLAAVLNKEPHKASELLKTYTTIANLPDQNGSTPLFVVRHVEMAKVLVEQGRATVNVSNKDGVTPLDMAVMFGENKVVEYLLSKGADVKAVDKNGLTPLHYATAMHRRLWENIGIGAAAYAAGTAGSLAMMAYLGMMDAVFCPPCAVVAAAIIASVIAVSLATRNSIVLMLLNAGANPNAQDYKGNTPLHILAEGKEGGTGSELEGRKKNGFIVAQILLNHGASRTIKNNNGQTPYDVALMSLQAQSGKPMKEFLQTLVQTPLLMALNPITPLEELQKEWKQAGQEAEQKLWTPVKQEVKQIKQQAEQNIWTPLRKGIFHK